MPKNAADIYESLRNQFLTGSANHSWLSVIFYHGVLRGLQILTIRPTEKPCTETSEAFVHTILPDNDLIHLIANMVLHKQSEAAHVY
jgi:hypothetical protein